MPSRPINLDCVAERETRDYALTQRDTGTGQWCGVRGRVYSCCRPPGHAGQVHVSMTYSLETVLDKWVGQGSRARHVYP